MEIKAVLVETKKLQRLPANHQIEKHEIDFSHRPQGSDTKGVLVWVAITMYHELDGLLTTEIYCS